MAKKLWLGEVSPLFQTELTSCGIPGTSLMYFWGKKLCAMNLGLIEEGENLSPERKGGDFREALTETCLGVENGVVFPERSHGITIVTRAVAEYVIVAFVFPHSVHVIIFFRISFDLQRYMLNFKLKNFPL